MVGYAAAAQGQKPHGMRSKPDLPDAHDQADTAMMIISAHLCMAEYAVIECLEHTTLMTVHQHWLDDNHEVSQMQRS